MKWMLRLYFFMLFSTAYGYINLYLAGKEVLPLTAAPVPYLDLARQRLLQMALAMTAFALFRAAKIHSSVLMKWWLQSICWLLPRAASPMWPRRTCLCVAQAPS